MIELFRSYFPLILTGLFIYKAQREPIYYLGIPFLMFFGSTIFMEKMRIFYMPGSITGFLGDGFFIFLWLLVSIFFINYQIKQIHYKIYPGRQKKNITDKIIFTLFLYSVILLITNIIFYKDLFSILPIYLNYIYLFIGYFLFKKVFSKFSTEDIYKFFEIIVIINTITVVFFILYNLLGMSIYDEKVQGVVESITQGQLIKRVYTFVPILMPFSFFYVFSKPKKKKTDYMIIVINFLGLFLTYTRSILINTLLGLIIFYLVKNYKSQKFSKSIFVFSGVSIALVIAFFVLNTILPAQTAFLADRIIPLIQDPTSISSNSLIVRQHYIEDIFKYINSINFIFGFGFVSTNLEQLAHYATKSGSADTVWLEWTFRFGIIGSSLLLSLFIVSIYNGFKSIKRISPDSINFIGIVIAQIFFVFMTGFISWTIIEPGKYALALWFFAVFSVLLSRIQKPDYA